MKHIFFLLLFVSFNALADAERIAPSSLAASSGVSNTSITNIDDDPDSPDGNWVTATGNNVTTTYRIDLGNPVGTLTVGADLQEFKAYVREFDTGQGRRPDCRFELWQSNILVRAGSENSITSTGEIITFTWNANEVSANGDNAQMHMVCTKTGGSPGNRNTGEFGALEWNATVDAASTMKVMLIN